MKKYIVLALMWVLAFVMPIAAFAQGAAETIDAELNLQNYFESLGTFAAIIIPVTAFLIKALSIEIKWIKQIISWIVAFGVGILAWIFQWGIFIGIQWYHAVLYCISAALVANGIFNIEVIKTILRIVGLQAKTKAA